MTKMTRRDTSRTIRSPRGSELNCKSWLTEAPFRMIQNNLDPEVAERPEDLVVYGGIGRAARNWESFDKILETLKTLEDDESLCVQSGKPVGQRIIHKLHQSLHGSAHHDVLMISFLKIAHFHEGILHTPFHTVLAVTLVRK